MSAQEDSLQRLVSRLPELAELLARIPGVKTRLHRLIGKDAEPEWRAGDSAYLTLLLYSAGLVERVDALEERVDDIVAKLADYESKVELVHASEQSWRALTSTRDGIVFMNSIGQTVTLSRSFVAVFIARRQLDVSEFVEDGEEIVVRVAMKPISTLMRGMPSVDVTTGEASVSARERSDVTAVPAASVVGEAMVALVLADALLDKTGGDSLAEVRRNLEGHLEAVNRLFQSR